MTAYTLAGYGRKSEYTAVVGGYGCLWGSCHQSGCQAENNADGRSAVGRNNIIVKINFNKVMIRSHQLTCERIEIPIKVNLKQEKPLKVNFGTVQQIHSDNYEDLYNKPKINDIILIGNKTSAQLRLQHEMQTVTEGEIDDIIYGGI